jgi:transcriptional regulator with XRE-family HTH domain
VAKITPFGKRIKKRLIDLEMTQTELGKRAGCGRKYLIKIMAGERSGGKYMESICKILDLPYTGSAREDTAKGA